jgi:hypothetical protein
MADTPHNPGSGYVLNWESYGCNAVPDLVSRPPHGSPYGWGAQYVNPSPVTGENNFRVACSPAEPVRNGGRSARFQLNLGDPIPGTTARVRTELAMVPDESLGGDGITERWYGFSIYLHSWTIDRKSSEILTQWHQSDSSPFGGSPPLAILTDGSNWHVGLRDWNVNELRRLASSDLTSDIGKWTDWVVHVKWSADPTKGVLEIWKNGNQLTLGAHGEKAFRGQNKFNDGRGNYMKFGIYKWDWTKCEDAGIPANAPECRGKRPPPPHLGPSDATQRTIYYDELRIADQRGSYNAVAPGTSLSNLDHLTLYRPGTGTIWILRNSAGSFAPVFAEGSPGNGIGGYNLQHPADRVFAFDYNGSGRLDHLVLYRPGLRTIYILRNEGGSFRQVFASGDGIGGYDLADPADRVFAFDYNA